MFLEGLAASCWKWFAFVVEFWKTFLKRWLRCELLTFMQNTTKLQSGCGQLSALYCKILARSWVCGRRYVRCYKIGKWLLLWITKQFELYSKTIAVVVAFLQYVLLHYTAQNLQACSFLYLYSLLICILQPV